MTFEFHIVPSYYYPDTYFIFRENGVEVRVRIVGNMALANRILTCEEKEYFEQNVLKNKMVLSEIGKGI